MKFPVERFVFKYLRHKIGDHPSFNSERGNFGSEELNPRYSVPSLSILMILAPSSAQTV